jgi:Rad3-related DNA helicase
MAILDSLRGGDLLTGRIGIKVAIFDEADRLLDAADSICVYRQRLSEAVRAVDAEDDQEQSGRLRAIEEVARRLLRSAGGSKALIVDRSNPEHLALIEQVESLDDALPGSARWCRAARRDGPIVALIEDSLGSVALTATGRHPARVARRLWEDGAYLRSVIFTSATGLDTLLREVNAEAHRLSGEFSPERFGALQFVLAGDDAPPPVADSEVSPAWRDYVTRRLREVRSAGGRALVLVPSYADAEALGASLAGIDHLLIHKRGELLQSLLPAFAADSQGMLITPAGWEGLDLPGLIDHLVIARIPFSPPDWARAELNGPGAAIHYSIARAKAKLTQGIGRAIRRETDKATVCILDRRFPLPMSALIDAKRRVYGAGIPQLRSAIPERFSRGPGSPYERARCLGEK